MRSCALSIALLGSMLLGCEQPRRGVTYDADGWCSTTGGPKPPGWKPSASSSNAEAVAELRREITAAEADLARCDAVHLEVTTRNSREDIEAFERIYGSLRRSPIRPSSPKSCKRRIGCSHHVSSRRCDASSKCARPRPILNRPGPSFARSKEKV